MFQEITGIVMARVASIWASSLPEKSYVALNINIDKTRRWILISKYHGGKTTMWGILPYLPKFYLEASENNDHAWIWRDYNRTEECVIP